MPINYTGSAAPPPGSVVSPDWGGSYEEWLDITARTMAENYAAGINEWQNFSGRLDDIGQPRGSDFGSAANGKTGVVSDQTYMYFRRFLQGYGANDPYTISHYGTPPARHASFEPDPNSPSSVQGTYAERAKAEAEQNALNRASEEKIAAGHDAANIQAAQIGAQASMYAANTQLQGVRERVAADIQIATMEDATRRYVAEGDWGTQRYVAELQDRGATTRLQMELGMRDKELVQRTVAEANRHQEQMTALAIQVAQYDADLAAQPRNWLKYAAWLKSRNVVVNGLTLAMAADMVPDNQISPATVANTTGSGLAAIQAAQESQQTAASGQTGGSTGPNPFTTPTAPLTTGQGQQGQIAPMQAAPSAAQLQQQASTGNYGDIARSLLNMNGLQGDESQANAGSLQSISNTFQTAGRKIAGFGAYDGPTMNALGMTVAEPTGNKVDYRQFSNLLPAQQQMKFGEVESIGRYAPDFTKEMELSRPKGAATGSVSFG